MWQRLHIENRTQGIPCVTVPLGFIWQHFTLLLSHLLSLSLQRTVPRLQAHVYAPRRLCLPISRLSSSKHSVSELTPLYLSAPFQILFFFHPSLQTLYYPRLESCLVLLTECVPGKPPTLDQSNRSLCTPTTAYWDGWSRS